MYALVLIEYSSKMLNKEFTKKYGIKVNYTTFESNENMYNKLHSGGANYDIVIP